MSLKTVLTSLLVLTASAALTSCGGKDGVNSDLLNMAVSDGGIILRTSAQSCTDKITGTTTDGTVTRSLTAPVLSLQKFQIQWLPTDYDLFIGALQITVIGSQITGGQQIIQLDATEVENLLGAPGATLTNTAATNNGVYTSTNTSKGKNTAGIAYAPCGLNVGGLTVGSSSSSGSSTPTLPTSQFTVSVEIEIIATASPNSLSTDANAKQKTVMKTIRTSATYY